MDESELDLIELGMLIEIIKPHAESRVSSKHARFFRIIQRKLELQMKKRSEEVAKEILSVGR